MVAPTGCSPAGQGDVGDEGDGDKGGGEEAAPVTLNLSVAASLTDAMEEIENFTPVSILM